MVGNINEIYIDINKDNKDNRSN